MKRKLAALLSALLLMAALAACGTKNDYASYGNAYASNGNAYASYGNAYASGRVDITGPLNKIQLVVNGSSAKSGDFHLPLGSSSSSSSRELLSFKQAESAEDADPYELMMANARQTKKQLSDLHFKARIRVTPELRAYIDIGDDNSLNAIGSGTLEIDSSTSQGFTLGGDYAIQDGSFHFSVLNLVSRNFTIQDGSTIRFNGDIWDSDLDVKGRYTTSTSRFRT